MKNLISLSLILMCLIKNGQEIADRIPFLDGDKYGYANNTGEMVIEAQYDWAFPFYKGAAKVGKNGFYGR